MIKTALVVASLFFFVNVGHASGNVCVEREAALAKLSKDYREKLVALGLTSDGDVLEVLVSPTGTWTILITTPQGFSCGMVSGKNWFEIKQIKGEVS